MWGDPDPDPGGQKEPQKAPSSQELLDLKDQNEQQLVLIAQLKEMLRKEQSNVTQEKVEEYVNTLSRAKAKRNSRAKKDESTSSSTRSTANIDANKKERINLLRQQLEENKAKLAERGKSQKGIEEMVTQLQAQLKDSQQLIGSAPKNVPLPDQKNVEYSKNTSQEELYNILLVKERKITELINKSQKLESTVLDLQENLKEKDSVIDARTKAITLMTDSLSKKGKSTLDALEETKEQMRKMQENFIQLESEMKARQVSLLNDLKLKNIEISDLQEVNNKLEEEKSELLKRIEDSLVTPSEEVDSVSASVNEELEKLKEENEKNLNKIIELEQIAKDKDLLIEDLYKKLETSDAANMEYKEKYATLEKQLEEAKSDLQRMKNTGFALGKSEQKDNSNEITKLKKQLDESNKNMIKIKAQNKSKVKELNKQLEQIKKTSDINALVVQLQKENSKLTEKVAELEEELGNLQLKMVESMSSSKDSSKFGEETKELDSKAAKFEEEIEEKNKIISILESEILHLKEEINEKEIKIKSLSDLETKQVTSEMTSIHYEEQLEIVENEKKLLLRVKEELDHEKEALLENIEALKKEKQELSAKLDNYIQENIDLIDKLEKLSAEKVSSAESIEIVEGLTPQEKLELAAYQQTINPGEVSDSLKCEQDITEGEPQIELNDSVLPLSEDTTELLHKIEMFTQERKEVMAKMEALKEENNMLIVKLKQVENNRDILEETYEQLQNEKEDLEAKLEQKDVSIDKENVETASEELTVIRTQYHKLLQDNEDLKRTLKEYDTIVHEKHRLESELNESQRKIAEFENKVSSNIEEINNYQQVIEENKGELISSSNIINQLQTKLAESENDVKDLNSMINELNEIIANLQKETNRLEGVDVMEKELNELKSALNSQLDQAQEYEAEIAQNGDTINNLNTQLIEVHKKIIGYENEALAKENEIQILTADIKNKDDIIDNLQKAIEEKDKNFKTVSEEIKGKYLGLQKQLDGNNDSVQKQVNELTNKNKEQLDKMKKIAASLKKKNQAYQELEEKYGNDKKTMEEFMEKVKNLEECLSSKTTELEGTERHIQILREQVQELEQKNVDLQNYILKLKTEESQKEVGMVQQLSNEGFVNQEKINALNTVVSSLQSELDSTRQLSDETKIQLEKQKSDLETKYGELEEKLKKVVANLKKKTQSLQELQKKYNEDQEQLGKLKQGELTITQLEEELKKVNSKNQDLFQEIQKKEGILELMERDINMLKEQEQNLQKINVDQQNYIQELKIIEEKQKEMIANQQSSFEQSNRSTETNQEKIHELNRFVDSLQNELVQLRQQSATLENSKKHLEESKSALEGKLGELEEKLKKVVANLKKKTGLYQELQKTYDQEKEKWETESREKDLNKEKIEEEIHMLIEKSKFLEEENVNKDRRLEENEKEINMLKDHLQSLERNNIDMQNYIAEQKHREEQNQINLQQELSTSLHEDFGNKSTEFINEEKVKELNMVIETLESELSEYKNKIDKLQEINVNLQEERSLMENRIIELEEKLNLTSHSFKEKSILEDQLELKLAEVSANDEVLHRKLKDSVTEHQELLKQNNENEELIKKLKIKLKKSQDRVAELKSLQNNLEELENLNDGLKKQVATLEINQKHIQHENESLQKRNMSDYEKIEADYQIQLEELLKEKNDLTVECEKLGDKIKEMQEREEELLMEVTEYKVKLEQSEAIELEEIERMNIDLKNSTESLQKSKDEIERLNAHIDGLQQELVLVKTAKTTVDNVIEKAAQVIDSSANVSTQTEDIKLDESPIHVDFKAPELQAPEVPTFDWSQVQSDSTADITIETPQHVEPQVAPQVNWFNMAQPDNLPNTQNAADWFNTVPNQPQANAQDWFSQSDTRENVPNSDNTSISLELPNALNVAQEEVPTSSAPVLETSKEALLSKIKALEFLLYNVDKEKEIALNECTEMFSEFSQMVYDKLNETDLPQPSTTISGLESQILSEQDIQDYASNQKELRKLEYGQASHSLGEQLQPVIEDTIKPKEAYLCFDEDHTDEGLQLPVIESQIQSVEDIQHLADKQALQQLEYAQVDASYGQQQSPVTEPIIQPKEAYICFNEDDEMIKPSTSMQSEIMSETDVDDMKRNKRELQHIEFEKVDPPMGEQKQPVVEPVAKPKTAYLCHTKDDSKQHSLEAFGENDDGWGWGPEEAKLEEEHIQSQQATPFMQNAQHEMQQLRENLLALQIERENHLEEIKQLQVKSGKLIKKCKELKVKNDELSKKSNATGGGADFFDLNETIQEELKGQVEKLEKKMKELVIELEKEKTEKSSIVKKADVLTAANERMIEMKEIQDTEVLRWQRKHNEALEKLKQYEWGNDGFTEQSKPAEKLEVTESNTPQIDANKVEELEKTLKELMLDNEELQTLLDEQVKLRSETDRRRSDEEYQLLQETIDNKNRELANNEDNLLQTTQKLEKLKQENDSLQQNASQLQHKVQEQDYLIVKLNEELQIISHQNAEVQSQASQQTEFSTRISQLEQQLADAGVTISEERSMLQEKDAIIDDLQTTFDQLNNKKIELEQQVKDLSSSNEQYNGDIALLKLEILNKDQQIQELFKQIEVGTQDLGQIERLQEEILRLEREINEKNTQVSMIVAEKEDVEAQMKNLKEELVVKTKDIEQNIEENTNLKEQMHQLQITIQNLQLEHEEKTSALMSELSESWQAQVDQRGADIAESWKLHLESVDAEHSAMQQKLQQEIAELEEKCNILVNENNELRKNVDMEIRNEVDKLSALQQQINSGQHTIAALNNTLLEKDKEINDLQNRVSQIALYEQENQRLSLELSEKESKLSSINILVDATQKQFDEKREVVEEIVRILEKQATAPLSFEKSDVLNEFKRQLNIIEEKNAEIGRLSQTVNDFHNQLNDISERGQEIFRLNEIIAGLQAQLSVITEKDNEISKISDELNQTKLSLDATQQEYYKLQQEHSNCATVLSEYQQQVLEYTTVNSTLQQTIEEKNQQISNLTQQLQIIDSNKNDSNKVVEELNREIGQLKQDCQLLQHGLSECQTELFNVSEQLKEKNESLEMVTQQLSYSQQNYEIQEQELNRLKQQLQDAEREYSAALGNVQQNQLRDLQNHYEELLHAKEFDMQHLKAQFEDLGQKYQESTEKLVQDHAVKTELEAKIAEQSALIEEENKQLSDLRLLIEDQVMKIEELKKELFDKSNQYDSIIAEMDMGRQAVTQQPSGTVMQTSAFSQMPPGTSQPLVAEDDLSEPVNRAELDIALYMLHQRDVRCEELTVELTQLLEERDTLQLRLSNAIREKEEILRRSTATADVEEEPSSSSAGNMPEEKSPQRSKSSAIFLAASGTELATEPLEMSSHNQNLATKLSELKQVGYKKDKTFVDEQEARRLQQLAIMQQHIHEASKLPPEAAAKLVDASYTLSRDVQSPSKVLLNWLWGRSTPKVNDT